MLRDLASPTLRSITASTLLSTFCANTIGFYSCMYGRNPDSYCRHRTNTNQHVTFMFFVCLFGPEIEGDMVEYQHSADCTRSLYRDIQPIQNRFSE
jgi:hypothetical protein